MPREMMKSKGLPAKILSLTLRRASQSIDEGHRSVREKVMLSFWRESGRKSAFDFSKSHWFSAHGRPIEASDSRNTI